MPPAMAKEIYDYVEGLEWGDCLRPITATGLLARGWQEGYKVGEGVLGMGAVKSMGAGARDCELRSAGFWGSKHRPHGKQVTCPRMGRKEPAYSHTLLALTDAL